ncbi:MAG: alpha/beta hydrolase, partial [Gammaproteobacteria bacterium]
IMKLDEQEKAFNFKKGLMINPPVSLYNSALLLDSYLRDNITTGQDAVRFWDQLTQVMGEEYAETQGVVQLGPDFLYEVYRKRRPDDENLAILIGLAFAITAQNMVTVADVLTQSGYVVPVGTTAKITADVTDYFIVSARTPFRLYFKNLLVPYYQRSNPDITEDDLINRASLYSIEEYLRTTDKVGLVHNVDDIIMKEGEIDWLVDVFGDRAKIWPRGGHCGNMAYKKNVDHMLAFFGASLPEGR